jgi:hypothetical protein
VHKYLNDGEQRVNTLGYKLLAENRTQDAITIFESNAQMHLESANAFDSLGEARMHKMRSARSPPTSVRMN